MIRKEFEKYGVIEDIELLQTGKPEAYVTYTDSRDASKAFYKIRAQRTFQVKPAHTWHQPMGTDAESHLDNSKDGLEDDVPSILQLNEDCLVEIFERCDFETRVELSNVCKLFKDILDRYFFPQVHAMDLDLNEKTLGESRKILRCVGKHVQAMKIIAGSWLSDSDVERCIRKMCQYVGENIRALSLHFGMRNVSQQVSLVEPILPRLHKLKIRHSYTLDLGFLAHCPNLTELKLDNTLKWNGTQSLALPNLQSFVLINKQDCRKDVKDIVHAFLEQNPQLKCVKASASDIESAIEYLTRVEKLSIHVFDNEIDYMNMFTGFLVLENLSKLSLCELLIEDLQFIFGHVSNLTKLRELKIYVHSNEDDEDYHLNYQAPIVAVAEKLINLKNFRVQGLTLLKSTIFDFVRHAKQLQELHIHDCYMLASSPLGYNWVDIHSDSLRITGNNRIGLLYDGFDLTDIVKARKSLRRPEISPLKLFLDHLVYDKFKEAYNVDAKQYLNVMCGCKHTRWFSCFYVNQADTDYYADL